MLSSSSSLSKKYKNRQYEDDEDKCNICDSNDSSETEISTNNDSYYTSLYMKPLPNNSKRTSTIKNKSNIISSSSYDSSSFESKTSLNSDKFKPKDIYTSSILTPTEELSNDSTDSYELDNSVNMYDNKNTYQPHYDSYNKTNYFEQEEEDDDDDNENDKLQKEMNCFDNEEEACNVCNNNKKSSFYKSHINSFHENDDINDINDQYSFSPRSRKVLLIFIIY